MNSRRFSLPQRYHGRRVLVHVDQDRSSGALNRDGPFITDPTQAVLVVELPKFDHHSAVLLVVRIQDLIKRVCSAHVDVPIPWDEWGRGAVVMEDQEFNYNLFIHVHGTHLVVLKTPYPYGRGDHFRVSIFDFSRHGCGTLPLWDEGGNGAGRKTSFSDGREFVCEGIWNRDYVPWGEMGFLGDRNLFHVSYLSHPIPTVSWAETLARRRPISTSNSL